MRKKRKVATKGRRPNLEAIKITHELINVKKLSFRDAQIVLAKRLGKKKVDIKSIYRWYQYELQS